MIPEENVRAAAVLMFQKLIQENKTKQFPIFFTGARKGDKVWFFSFLRNHRSRQSTTFGVRHA